MKVPSAEARFDQAAMVLPPEIRERVYYFTKLEQQQIEEFRLRVGQPVACVFPDGERSPANAQPIRARDLERVLEIASEASFHTVADKVRRGFVTIRGGHRIGLCGTAVMKGGEVANFRQLSSLCIRIAREVPGAAKDLLPRLTGGDTVESTLIVAPPGYGKTTLLRDLIRMVSDGIGTRPMRVGIADERGELAALYDSMPQMDVGTRTDVVDGCPKAEGLMMLLRGMRPQVLAADEITAPADIAALEQAGGCGTVLLATAHGYGAEDLKTRPLYRQLLDRVLFRRIVVIEMHCGARRYRILDGRQPL